MVELKHIVPTVNLVLIALLAACGNAQAPVSNCTGAIGQPCYSNQVKKIVGVCISDVTCSPFTPRLPLDNVQATIQVKYPEKQIKASSKSLFIRGSGLGLSWKTGIKMKKTAADTWELPLKYTVNSNNQLPMFQCLENCLAGSKQLSGPRMEFRVFINDDTDMKGANFVMDLPLSMQSSHFSTPPKKTVYPWFYHIEMDVKVYNMSAPLLPGKAMRLAGLFLPQSFKENTYKSYPTLFLMDMIAWPIISTIESEVLLGRMNEIVVIGFSDYPGDQRTKLLTPYTAFEWACKDGSLINRCAGCLPSNISTAEAYYKVMKEKCGKLKTEAGYADQTLDFLLNTIGSQVKRDYPGRIIDKQPDTGIVGYSLGGLISCYAAWTRPGKFGKAGCMSSSFWYPTNKDMKPDFSFINITLKDSRYLQNRPRQSIYIDVGAPEQNVGDTKMVSAAIDVFDELKSYNSMYNHFVENENLWLTVRPKQEHGTSEFYRRLWMALTTLYKPDGGFSFVKEDADVGKTCNSAIELNAQLKWFILLIVSTIYVQVFAKLN